MCIAINSNTICKWQFSNSLSLCCLWHFCTFNKSRDCDCHLSISRYCCLYYYDGIAESLVLCIVGIVSERWLKSLGLFCLSSQRTMADPALSRIVLHFSILRVVSQFKWTLRYSIHLSVGCHSLLPVLYLILSAIFWPLTLATVFDVFTCRCCRFPLLLSLSLYSFSCCCGYVS